MRRVALFPVFLAVLLFLGAAPASHAAPDATPRPPSAAHPTSEAVKKELTAVIDGQLAAFRANDYTKAFTFASADIQSMFAPDDFKKMVETSYPVIAHSTLNEYGLMFDTGEEAVVNVRVENGKKESVEYQYMLKKETGGWKITGVSQLKADGLSV